MLSHKWGIYITKPPRFKNHLSREGRKTVRAREKHCLLTRQDFYAHEFIAAVVAQTRPEQVQASYYFSTEQGDLSSPKSN